MKKTWQKGRRNHGIDIILVDLFTISIISILLLCNLFIHIPDVKGVNWEKVVKSEDKDYNIHILTNSELSQLYTCKYDGRLINTQIIELTQEEAQMLMLVGRQEGGPTLEGQLWAMRTIINRLYDNRFANNIYDIITQQDGGTWQFEVVKTGAYKRAELNSNSHIALAMIEGGWNKTQGALFFEASSNTENSWHTKNLTFIKEVEGNRYYR